MKVTFYTVPAASLDRLPKVSGQLICTSDVDGFYYDMNDTRHQLQPSSNLIYSLIDSDDVTATGISTPVNYTVDTGNLEGLDDYSDSKFSGLEFIFYDRGTGTQFSDVLHGLEYDTKHYTYAFNNKLQVCHAVDTTQTANNGSIYRETLYATVSVTADGKFQITQKTKITESVTDGIVTMKESDITADNRLCLFKVIGRRS